MSLTGRRSMVCIPIKTEQSSGSGPYLSRANSRCLAAYKAKACRKDKVHWSEPFRPVLCSRFPCHFLQAPLCCVCQSHSPDGRPRFRTRPCHQDPVRFPCLKGSQPSDVPPCPKRSSKSLPVTGVGRPLRFLRFTWSQPKCPQATPHACTATDRSKPSTPLLQEWCPDAAFHLTG